MSENKKVIINRGGDTGALYGLGVIGAAVYFVSHTTGFWNVIVAIVKAFFWPAFLVYQVFAAMKIV